MTVEVNPGPDTESGSSLNSRRFARLKEKQMDSKAQKIGKRLSSFAALAALALCLMGAGATVGIAGTSIFKARTDQTAPGTPIVRFQDGTGTDKCTVDIGGNIVCAGSITAGGTLSANANELAVASIRVPDGGLAITSGNFTVGGTTRAGTAISGATVASIKGIMTWTSGAVDVGNIASKGVVTQTFSLSGVAPGDVVQLVKVTSNVDAGVDNSLQAGLTVSCEVKVANVISCDFTNNTASGIDPAAWLTYSFLIFDLT